MRETYRLLEKVSSESEVIFQTSGGYEEYKLERFLKAPVDSSKGEKVLLPPRKTPEVLNRLLTTLKGEGVVIPLSSFLVPASKSSVLEDIQRPSDLDLGDKDVVAVIYTSGSTGSPKGVVVTDEMMTLGIQGVSEHLGYTEDSVVLNVLPWFFDAGLNQLLSALASKSKVVVLNHWHGALTTEVIREQKVTHITGVPTLWHSLVEEGSVCESVLQIANTGSTLTTSLAEKLKSIFPNSQIIPMYGTTEGHCRATIGSDFYKDDPSLTGTPTKYSEVEVVDGEVVLSGPIVSPGYWRGDQGGFRDGKFFTGDLGEWSEDGQLRLLGRRTEFMKIRGVRVSPSEVESCYEGLSVAFERDGVHYLAYEGENVTLPPLFSEFTLVKYDRLPLLPNGKVDRKKVQDATV